MSALADLQKACGEEHARPAAPADAVQGVEPSLVASPGSTDEAAEVLSVAAAHGLHVVARGTGTRLDWGSPPSDLDLVVDVSRMSGVVEHAAGDLVTVVRAGTPLAALQTALAPKRQRLALDPPDPGGGTRVGMAAPAAPAAPAARTVSGTVGGAVATNASGPLRLGYGTPRDLLIGVTVVRADGKVAHAGGRVVKNVAGYDLGKLLAGSHGTLGIITETIFRLHPLPPAAAYLSCPVEDPDEAHRRVQALVHAQLVPVAVELDLPAPGGPGTVGLLLEGIEPGVEARTRQALALLGKGTVQSRQPPPWWGRYPFGTGDVALRLTAEIAALPHVLDALG
ncbi:MAG: FAD-binding oxidoreductase, partial [Carbonactinosporaceae bacterium]